MHRLTRLPRVAPCAFPLLALLLFACSSQDAEDTAEAPPSASASAESPAPAPAAQPPAPEAENRLSRYSSIAKCPLVKSAPEEAGFYEYECPGEGGYDVRLVEADLRQNIVLTTPG